MVFRDYAGGSGRGSSPEQKKHSDVLSTAVYSTLQIFETISKSMFQENKWTVEKKK